MIHARKAFAYGNDSDSLLSVLRNLELESTHCIFLTRDRDFRLFILNDICLMPYHFHCYSLALAFYS